VHGGKENHLMHKLLTYWKLLLYLPLAAFLTFASYHYARNGIVKVEAQQSLTVKPFIAEFWVTSYVQNPAGEIIEKKLLARSSDGTTATNLLAVMTGPGTTPTRQLVTPDGRRIQINDTLKIRSTFYLSQQELARVKNGLAKTNHTQTNCSRPGEVFIGNAVVAGHDTQIWQRDSTLQDASLVRVSNNRAPDLGCMELETKFEEAHPGQPFKLRTTETAQFVTEAEPTHADLDTGDTYREVAPSELIKKTERAVALTAEWCNNHDCSHMDALQNDLKDLEKRDLDYTARRAQKEGGKL
jgi:hypothetical protein